MQVNLRDLEDVIVQFNRTRNVKDRLTIEWGWLRRIDEGFNPNVQDYDRAQTFHTVEFVKNLNTGEWEIYLPDGINTNK